jgi:hypothetical protein
VSGKQKRQVGSCTTLTLYFCVFSTLIEKHALDHRPGQPVQWRECSLSPKAGRHDGPNNHTSPDRDKESTYF